MTILKFIILKKDLTKVVNIIASYRAITHFEHVDDKIYLTIKSNKNLDSLKKKLNNIN